MGKPRRKAKSPASGSTYKGITLPREKARWVWMGLAGAAVPEVRTFWTRLMALLHCMVRHSTVQYGSLLGGFALGTVPGIWYFF